MTLRKTDTVILVVGIFASFAASWSGETLTGRVAAASSVLAVLFLVLYLSALRASARSSKGTDRPQFATGISDALRAVMEDDPSSLRVLTYVGNGFFTYFQENPPDRNIELRMLVRDPLPEAKWAFPASGSHREGFRKGQTVGHLRNRIGQPHKYGSFRAPAGMPERDYVRHYSFEPVLRAVVAETSEGLVGYFGLYRVVQRGDEDDYSASGERKRGRPLIRVESSTDDGQRLLEDFVSWFDHFHAELATPCAIPE